LTFTKKYQQETINYLIINSLTLPNYNGKTTIDTILIK